MKTIRQNNNYIGQNLETDKTEQRLTMFMEDNYERIIIVRMRNDCGDLYGNISVEVVLPVARRE